MSDLISVRQDGHVRHITLNRADKRNAFNRELVLALHRRPPMPPTTSTASAWC